MKINENFRSRGNVKHFLLIASVDGIPEPVIASIYHWRPERILFVSSNDIVDGIDHILGELDKRGYELAKSQYKMIELADPSDFTRCVHEMVGGLAPHVAEWCENGEEFECIVDFTGGTKCMTAALALVARPWPKSSFSYIVGKESDQNGGEQIVHSANPWNALGYQTVEDAKEAFDRHAFSEGVRMLKEAKEKQEDDGRKQTLHALETFMKGYDLWSQFEYRDAHDKFVKCRVNDLVAALIPASRKCIEDYISEAKLRLESLKNPSNHPTRELLEDLISDAWRRRDEGRHVDAVARLYRAVEATAQLRIWERFQIHTNKIPVDKLPESMRPRLGPHSEDRTATSRGLIEGIVSIFTGTQSKGEAATDKTVTLGLQDSYEFLIRKEDPLGERFASLGWNGKKSPLSMRNNSIAGHGFAPVSSEISDELWTGTLELAELSEEQVFRFPRLGPLDAP